MTDAPKILVVDDEPDICEIVEITLADAGFDVSSQTTGAGVVERVLNDRIDLVVLDLGLPGTDGLTLTRSLKERTDVGVVILSGRGETTEMALASKSVPTITWLNLSSPENSWPASAVC